MKTKILFVILAFMGSSMLVHAQENFFEKLSEHDEVSTVFISKTLLKMMPDMDMKADVDLKSLANKLEKMEIYNTENKSAMDIIRKEMTKIAGNKSYESLMTIKDKESKINFYGLKDKNKFKDLIMYVNSIDGCTIIRIVGSFTTEDIQAISKTTSID